jgi:hypothetical protein
MRSQRDVETITDIISSYGFLLIQIPNLRYDPIGLVGIISEFGLDRAELIVCQQHEGSLSTCVISGAPKSQEGLAPH